MDVSGHRWTEFGVWLSAPVAQRSKKKLFWRRSYARLRCLTPSISRKLFGVRKNRLVRSCLSASRKWKMWKMWRRLTFFVLWFSIQQFPKSLAVQPRICSAVSKQGSKRFCTCVGLSISPIAYLVYTNLTSTSGSLSPAFFHEWWLSVAQLECDCM